MTVSEQYKEYKELYWDEAVSYAMIRKRKELWMDNIYQPRIYRKVNIKKQYEKYQKKHWTELSYRWFINRLYNWIEINMSYQWLWWDRKSICFNS
jgi:hypothetical protein